MTGARPPRARRARPRCRRARSRASSARGRGSTGQSRNRWWPKISCWKRIFSTTSCGLPDEVRAAQRARRLEVVPVHRRPAALPPDLGHHRVERRPGRVGRLLRGVRDVPVRVDAERGRRRGPPRGAARRWISANGAKRSGIPPMIASAIGRPSVPARAADCGVAADRDPDRQRLLQRPRVDARSSSGARWRPDQVTRSVSRSRSSRSSFSANSSS